MQEQEAQLEEARAQLASRSNGDAAFHASHDAKLAEYSRRAHEAQTEVTALRDERDRLAAMLDDVEAEAGGTQDHRFQLAQEQADRLQGLLSGKESQLRAAAERAQTDAAALEDAQAELDEIRREADDIAREVADKDRQLAATTRQADALRQQLDDAEGNRQRAVDEARTLRKQLERRADDAALALDDATAPLQSQLRAAEDEQRRLQDDAAALRHQLREEREQRAARSSDGDAQRRLANEADSLRRRLADRDAEVAQLNRQAAERDALVTSARREAGRLRALHEGPEAVKDKDVRIAELEATKDDLARRLRLAEMVAPRSAAGMDTPARSFAFKSVIGIPTPKTPGHYLRNVCPPLRATLHIV
jgi:colicin import membrane protein